MPGDHKAQGMDRRNKCWALGSRSKTLMAFTCDSLSLSRSCSECLVHYRLARTAVFAGGGQWRRVDATVLMLRVTCERVQVFQDAEVVVQLIASDVDVEGDDADDAHANHASALCCHTNLNPHTCQCLVTFGCPIL